MFDFVPKSSALGGNLDFGTVPAPGDYYTAYGNANRLNQQMYANQLAGWNQLSQNVLANLQGSDAARKMNISDQYAMASSKGMQGLISRGLGNSTIQNAVRSGFLRDKSNSDTESSAQTARDYANFQSNLGTNMLGWMNTVRADYPRYDEYNRFNQQQGAVDAANRNRQVSGRITSMAMPQRGSGIGGVGSSREPTLGSSGSGYSPYLSQMPSATRTGNAPEQVVRTPYWNSGEDQDWSLAPGLGGNPVIGSPQSASLIPGYPAGGDAGYGMSSDSNYYRPDPGVYSGPGSFTPGSGEGWNDSSAYSDVGRGGGACDDWSYSDFFGEE